VTWRTRWLLSGAAAAIVAGSWLLALAVNESVPPLSGALAPPPISTKYSVTPGYSYEPTVYPVTTAVPVGVTPPVAIVNDPCQAWKYPTPSVFRHPRCPVWPSPGPYQGH
jgi:hypothetical protein